MMQPKISYVIPEEALVRLNSINNYTALIDLFKRLMLNVFLCYLLFTATNYSYSLAVIIWYIYSIQFQFWGYAGLGHEALHGRVFSSRVANQILYAFCSALTWNNSAMFRSTHLFHHRKTFSPDDLEAKSEQRWGLWDVLSYIFIDFRTLSRRLYYSIFNCMGFYPNLMRLSPRYQRAAQINLTFNAVLYSSIYTLSENLFFTLLMFIAPFSATLLNKLLAKAQHHNLDGFSNDGALKFSRTLSLPKLLSFLYANMNYHAEHHFSPATPYYNLPELHKILASRNLITSQPFLYFLRSELKWNELKNDR